MNNSRKNSVGKIEPGYYFSRHKKNFYQKYGNKNSPLVLDVVIITANFVDDPQGP